MLNLSFLLEWLIVFSPLKYPLGIKLYLNIIPCFIGLFYLTRRKLYTLSFPLLIMALINGIYLTFIKDWGSLLRIIQFISLISFSQYIADSYTLDSIDRFLKRFSIVSLVIFIMESFWHLELAGYRNVFGINLYRFQGPVGETNYSSILLAGLFCLSLSRNKKLLALLYLTMALACVSRTGLLVCSLGLLFFLFNGFIKKRKVSFSWIFLTIVASFPLIIIGIESYTSLEFKKSLEHLSSGRYYLFLPYVKMGFTKVFGLGYFNGQANFLSFQEPYKEIISAVNGSYIINEQHNIIIQVFSEFGVIGFSLFLYFLKGIITHINKEQVWMLGPFVALFSGYLFLNGLNDIILHIFFGIILMKGQSISFNKKLQTSKVPLQE